MGPLKKALGEETTLFSLCFLEYWFLIIFFVVVFSSVPSILGIMYHAIEVHIIAKDRPKNVKNNITKITNKGGSEFL
ncbi:hypothetical protein Hdeb2414_s0143g00811971 [Helianthus debilis subsp. tardiflorus]